MSKHKHNTKYPSSLRIKKRLSLRIKLQSKLTGQKVYHLIDEILDNRIMDFTDKELGYKENDKS